MSRILGMVPVTAARRPMTGGSSLPLQGKGTRNRDGKERGPVFPPVTPAGARAESLLVTVTQVSRDGTPLAVPPAPSDADAAALCRLSPERDLRWLCWPPRHGLRAPLPPRAALQSHPAPKRAWRWAGLGVAPTLGTMSPLLTEA